MAFGFLKPLREVVSVFTSGDLSQISSTPSSIVTDRCICVGFASRRLCRLILFIGGFPWTDARHDLSKLDETYILFDPLDFEQVSLFLTLTLFLVWDPWLCEIIIGMGIYEDHLFVPRKPILPSQQQYQSQLCSYSKYAPSHDSQAYCQHSGSQLCHLY